MQTLSLFLLLMKDGTTLFIFLQAGQKLGGIMLRTLYLALSSLNRSPYN